jgi:signal transduction histidine kinase
MNPPETVPFGEIVREALQLVEGRLVKNNVDVEVDAELPLITGDRARLVEVVQNLVDNAAKFMGTQIHPRVQIGAHRDGEGRVIFHVRDNGLGIEPDIQEKIFNLFYKFDPNTEGTGLGLALAKRIIEVHGGEIWLESEGSGKGTTFFFTLAETATAEAAHGT